MKKANLLKRTALSILISSAIATGVQAAGTSFLDFSSVSNFSTGINLTQQFTENNVFNSDSGTVTFRIKANEGFSNLLGVSDANSNVRYVSFYMIKDAANSGAGEIFGMEVRNNSNLIHNDHLKTAKLAPSADGYRTVTYTLDQANQSFKIYIDGVLKKEHNAVKFFSDIPGLNTATLGSLTRQSTNYSPNTFKGGIYGAEATSQVLNADQVRQLHQDLSTKVTINLQKEAERQAYLAVKREEMGAYKSDTYRMFQPGQGGAASYRIPGLLTTKDGVTIAAIDKRNQHASDWGNIDLAIRRSFDNGKTWQDDQVIVDLATQPYTNLGEAESALVIDAVMVQNKENGRITLVFDMFPESYALFGMFSNNQASFESEGNGHVKVGDKWYPLITDNTTGERFTIREEGIVYNRLGEAQPYKVVMEGDRSIAFKDLGNIINLQTNQVEGNIYLRSKKAGHNSGRFNAHYTSYLWVTHSDDNGATWSSPVDITTQVKEDWMRFLGTGPGTGIQLKNGNLMIPVYYTNRDNKQSAAVIVSKDGGKTWERGESPNDAYLDEIGGSRYLNTQDYELTESQVVEMNNGDIKMFSRNRTGAVIISTSRDGGMTWDKGAKLREAALLEPYSQMSVIHYSKLIDGKEYLVFANPHANQRRNGKAWLGEVQEDGSIQWKYSTDIHDGAHGDYAYNSLSELANGRIGLLYEAPQGRNIDYVSFNLQELFWKGNYIYRDSRDTEHNNVSLNSREEETFYKIGDGEMVKVGEGINPAKLEVREGIATLKQVANNAGDKQAYSAVTVKANATLRMADEGQVNLSNVTLEKGSNFDLNGTDFHIAPKDGTEATGLRGLVIAGNIVNNDATAPATLTYGLNGGHNISGNLGNDNGVLNLTYAPTESNSHLNLSGKTKLGDVTVGGELSLAELEDGAHLANNVNVNTGGKVTYNNTNAVVANAINVARGGELEVFNSANLVTPSIVLENAANLVLSQSGRLQTTQVVSNISGAGSLIKEGSGYAKVTGELSHSGTTSIMNGTFELAGNITQSAVNIASNSILTGKGSVGGDVTLGKNATIIPTRFVANAASFEGNTLTLNNVNNQGGALALTVNNNSDDVTSWKHDKVLIKGRLSSDEVVPVHIQLLGTMAGKSDTNNDGKYGADEGISLIQVKNIEDFSRLKVGTIASYNRNADLYPLTVVRVESGVSNAADNALDATKNNQFYDFRLQNKIIKEDGTELDPTIRVADVNNQNNNGGNNVNQNRTLVQPRVASYITANTVMLNQGNLVSDTFVDNLLSGGVSVSGKPLHGHSASQNGKPGFYVVQSYSNNKYESNRGFVDYGYDYKAKQNTTLFGGYVPVTANTELHTAIAFSKYNVEPKAADGYSKGKYKTVSGLVAVKNQWDNIRFNLGVGYHRHSGDITTAAVDKAGKVKAHQTQVFTQIGYEIPFGQFSLTPMAGLSYQSIDTRINDSEPTWNVEVKDQNIFSQQIGTLLSWKGDKVRFNFGAFYENVGDKEAKVRVSPTATSSSEFSSGKLGNNLLVKASSEIDLLPNLTFGVQVGHRQSVSSAKLKQTNVSGKLEYKF